MGTKRQKQRENEDEIEMAVKSDGSKQIRVILHRFPQNPNLFTRLPQLEKGESVTRIGEVQISVRIHRILFSICFFRLFLVHSTVFVLCGEQLLQL